MICQKNEKAVIKSKPLSNQPSETEFVFLDGNIFPTGTRPVLRRRTRLQGIDNFRAHPIGGIMRSD